MFVTEPKTDYSTVSGVKLTLTANPDENIDPLNSNLILHKGYYEIKVTNEGGNPFIKKEIDYFSIGVIRSKLSDLPRNRFLNDNTVLVLAGQEILDSIELTECKKTFAESNESYFGLWLDITLLNTETNESNTKNVLLIDYLAGSDDVDTVYIN